MSKLYRKNELWFALAWIFLYVLGSSAADNLSMAIGMEKLVTLGIHGLLCASALIWLKREGLFRKYGLCRAERSLPWFLYLPLALLASCNLWLGAGLKMSLPETLLYVLSMLCVGFLEELIFRGFLFQAMRRNNLRSAIIVSSLTFGIGHAVNLFNGSGATLVSNLCQVCYAVAFGFMFVTLFYRSGSLLPCILTHGVLNALSAFSREDLITPRTDILLSLFLCVIALGYTRVLIRLLPAPEKAEGK